jgi:hypothetical protein
MPVSTPAAAILSRLRLRSGEMIVSVNAPPLVLKKIPNRRGVWPSIAVASNPQRYIYHVLK